MRARNQSPLMPPQIQPTQALSILPPKELTNMPLDLHLSSTTQVGLAIICLLNCPLPHIPLLQLKPPHSTQMSRCHCPAHALPQLCVAPGIRNKILNETYTIPHDLAASPASSPLLSLPYTTLPPSPLSHPSELSSSSFFRRVPYDPSHLFRASVELFHFIT